MSHDMTQHFHESNLIEGYDSPEADMCLAVAWRYLSTKKKLTHGVVRTVQNLATSHQTDLKPEWRGKYREIDVWIGGKKGLNPFSVHGAMKLFLSQIKIEPPKEAHIIFEKIHPFVDGNGRTGRLLMWWQEVQLGMIPTLIKYDERYSYYDWFR